MTSSGRRIEKSSTRSKSSWPATASSREFALSRTNGSSAAIRRGVKAPFTSLRCHRCSGSSITMSRGVPTVVRSRVTPPALLNVVASACAAETSSWRESAQKPISSLWYTGAESRSSLYTG